MAAKKMVASLSEDGWVGEARKILDYLFSYYILTDDAQSYLFENNLTSLPKTYFKYINDPIGFSNAIRSEFSRLLEGFFQTVDVKADTKQDAINTTVFYTLLSASVIDDTGTRHDLIHILESKDTVTNKTIGYSNYGDAYNDFINI